MPTRLLAATLAGAALLVATLVPATSAAAAPADLVINEVESNGDVTDWVEFKNIGAEPLDISDWVVRDSTENNPFTFAAGTVVAPGAWAVADLTDEYFGLGGSDSVRLFDARGALLVTYSYTAHALTTYGRCADGTGELVLTAQSSKGGANVCEVDPAGRVVINEAESNGDATDWIELKNISGLPVDISGLVLRDSTEADGFTVPVGTVLAPGGYFVADVGGVYFGLGGADAARLLDGATEISSTSWSSHAAVTWGRCPDGTGPFGETATSTKGAANVCATAAVPTVRVNEVESNLGTPGDWAELHNYGVVPVDMSGWVFTDDDPTHNVVFPADTVIPAGGFFVVEEAFFGNGLGADDSARLFLGDGAFVGTAYSGATLVDERSWTGHASTTYGICGAAFVTTTSPTKGSVNDCSAPIRINEVESNDGAPGDWIELKNNGTASVDLAGWTLRDSTENDPYVFPAASTIAGGAYVVVDAGGAVFGLGGTDAVRLFSADGTQVDTTSWTAHAATTLGRCPDGTGDFVATTSSTRGAPNACPGDLQTSPWPGSPDIAVADEAGLADGDVSGVVFDGADVWAVSNGDGLLYRLVRSGTDYAAAAGWERGRVLRYPTGAGTVDAEGVAVTSAGASGGVYVSSERDNTAGGVSRLSVLRYDVSAAGAELTATDEWNLTGILPPVGANLGLEGIAWLPDSWLTEGGFVDPTTGEPYDPADYPGHGAGLFAVGVEADGAVHVLALLADGTPRLVATVDSGLEIVADLDFDPERGALWVACDDTCGGVVALFDISATGALEAVQYFDRPAGMPNLNNEGFAVAPRALCVDGLKPVLWADDGDTGGNSLRAGSIACTELEQPATTPADPTRPAELGRTGSEPSLLAAGAALVMLVAGLVLTLRRRTAG